MLSFFIRGYEFNLTMVHHLVGLKHRTWHETRMLSAIDSKLFAGEKRVL